jgi:uncharacterized protein (DUF1800 family)
MARPEKHVIAHLLRRAGFGGNAALVDEYAALGFEGAVDRLVNFERVDDGDTERVLQQMRAASPASTNDKHPEYGNPALEIALWLVRMLLTNRPLQEKMTFFWHGHFTSAIQDVKFASLMRKQMDLYRANALSADFKAFTKAVARDPAMLLYLDNNTNRKGKPNENWARELMELFTLGIGNYTEQDVKEAARAFTGWTLTGRAQGGDPQFVFRPAQHDADSKTFLGVTGNLNGDDVVDIIFTQPVHTKLMARKLFRFLVYDDPDEVTVNRFADIYRASGFSVRELVTQILLSPEFRSDRAYFSLIKSPTEFTIGALRALSDNNTDLNFWRGVNQQMAIMGQQIFAPPNVGGWPGNRTWINSTTFYARANLADRFVAINSDATVDPTEIAQAAGVSTPQAAVDYFLEILLQSDVPADYRATLLKYVGSPANAREADGKLRGMVRLIMSSPVYQLN